MPELRRALNDGLDAGLSINQIKEVLVQLYAYAGFPRSLNALGAFMTVLDERKNAGIEDEAGEEPGPVPADSLAAGTRNQTRLTGAPVTGALFEFAPAIDHFLKAHLFGDIFGRDNLDWRSREIATIAALAGLDGLDSQLASHLAIGRNIGLSEDELRDAAAG
ncbi:carboxymuconolactone decarboxylase [Cryptosporangium phraense]|uniref:Carboxymuconolactone decarboxylase n=2 Tax=Cryptosporangium phraense TaxID=2593070 RepID=A0A545AMM2_9ACTN|nr:carboxymuconolactone decarboxylase [Cryptosporangium phraense]